MSKRARHLAAIMPLKGGTNGRISPPEKGHSGLCGASCQARAPDPNLFKRKDFGTCAWVRWPRFWLTDGGFSGLGGSLVAVSAGAVLAEPACRPVTYQAEPGLT